MKYIYFMSYAHNNSGFGNTELWLNKPINSIDDINYARDLL